MRGAFAFIGLIAAGACSDPTITIAIDWSLHPALDGKVTELRVTVDALADQDCAALRDGKVSAAALALGLQTAVTVPNDHRAHPIDDVPRRGAKLFVLEGYDATHQRIAAGCRDHGDIDADLALTITAKPVIVTRVRLDPEQTPSVTLPRVAMPVPAPADQLTFYARELATGHAAFTGDAPFVLRTVGHPADLLAGTATVTAADEGLFAGALPVAMPPELAATVGPVEVVLRVPWAERVERIAAFVPAAPLGGVVRTVAADEVNTIPPDWSFVLTPGTAPDDVLAAALVEVAGQPRRILVAREGGPSMERAGVIASPLTAEVRALEGLRRGADSMIVALTASGWYRVDPAPALVPVAAGPGVAADQLIAVPNCAAPLADLGMLVRTGARWDAYPTLGPTPAATGPLMALAAGVTNFIAASPGAALESVQCVSAGSAIGAVAIVTVPTAGGFITRYAVSNQAAPALLPFVGAVTFAVLPEGRVDLVGPVATDTGTRAISYRVKAGSTELIPSDHVDYALPGVPLRMIVIQAVAPEVHPDVLALVSYQGGVTLSVTQGGRELGDELTALVRTGLTGQSPRFVRLPLIERVDDPRLELGIAGDSGLVAFDMSTPAHAQP